MNNQMWVQIYRECGYEEAARAARLSRESQEHSDTIGDNLGVEDMTLFLRLLNADASTEGQPHSVGLRQVIFWIGCNMPLYWWKHMDRYTIGKDQASSSTRYNLLKRPLTQDDFAGPIYEPLLDFLNSLIATGSFELANRNLPHSYLQERALMISLPTLRRIIEQRRNHPWNEWKFFCNEIIKQSKYPDLIV